jgi:hypothetical protein
MNYRIVCTEQEPVSAPPKHAHIVAVGVGTNPETATERLTFIQVIQMIEAGSIFYTQGVQTGKVARVEKYWCNHCGRYHIRSSPDATTENNLDNLRYCNWKR